MTNKVVVGSQWGDEGKAKITDLLAHDADLIIRYQGGCNAGHTVVADNKTYKFHLIPSGILYKGKTCFIGAGTVILPEAFEQEVSELIAHGIDVSGLKISPLASITMPYHTEVDGYSENNAGKGKIGTTKKGIGPTYTDKAARIAFKIGDLYNTETLNEKLDIILPIKNKCWKKCMALSLIQETAYCLFVKDMQKYLNLMYVLSGRNFLKLPAKKVSFLKVHRE